MNKKDVLGASADAGNIQKMESTPHAIQCWNCSKSSTAPTGTAGSFGGIWYLIPCQNKSFNYFSRELNLQIICIFVVFDIKMISNVAHATFCKVFLLYANYAIIYILRSIN